MSVISSKTFAGMAFLFLLAVPATAAEKQTLTPHIPTVVQKMKLTPVGPLPSDARLTLQIGLPLRNAAEFNQRFQDLYNPASPQFHQWLTPAQIAENYGPADSDYQAVIAFARSNHIQVIHSYADHTLLTVNGSAGDIEKSFHLKLQVYQHPSEARTFYAPDAEPSLDLSTPILHITGLDNFHISRPGITTGVAPKNDDGGGGIVSDYTPDGTGPTNSFWGNDFRSAYVPGVSLTGSGQIIGLFSIEGYNTTNIVDYETRSGVPSVHLTNALVDGVVLATNHGETSLDIEMAASMAPGVTEIIVYQGTSYLDILKNMQTDNLAQQLSCSFSLHADTNMDTIFIMNAMQGQSFFQSSGDHGAYCADNTSDYADDPYVTIVGGTMLNTATPGGPWSAEVTWPGSGGGISGSYIDDYPTPYWQQGVNMSLNGGSTTQRNSPDVSMVANSIWNEGPGGPTIGSGTSFSTPLWAGFMALVNQQAAALGKPRVGFINPIIYAIGEGPGYTNFFHDLASGSNPSTPTGTNAIIPNVYYATNGYDLCTGWGSPNGSNMINLLVQAGGAVWVDFNYTGSPQLGTFDNPYPTLALGVTNVPIGGYIFIKSGTSAETMTIKKAMTLDALNGAATAGK